jgi:Tfp pilus assembly protein PilE
MNNKGISVISLVMTIVVIIIIASVTVYNGLNMIEQSRIRALRDTMQAVSETCTLIWKEANGDVTKLIGTKLGEDPDIYVVTPDDLKLMNLSNIDKTFTVNYRTSQVSYLDEKTGQTIYYPENIDMPDPTSL